MQTPYLPQTRCLVRHWHHKGPKHKNKPMDTFFMPLHVQKTGERRHYNAAVFRRKAPAFGKCMWTIIEAVHSASRKQVMNKLEEKISMTYIVQHDFIFRNFPYAQYATERRL